MDPAQTSEMDCGPEGAARAVHRATMTTTSSSRCAKPQTDTKAVEDEAIHVFMAPAGGLCFGHLMEFDETCLFVQGKL